MAENRFYHMLAQAGEAAGPGAGLAPPAPEMRSRLSAEPVFSDLVVGLAVRTALVVQLWSWARANAAPLHDRLDWRSWLTPSEGLVQASSVWLKGQVDPGLAAFVLLAGATLAAILLTSGLLARVAGLMVMAGALWHAVFILPEAWPSDAAYMAMGLYLVIRGAGAISLDWILARLSRLG